MTIPILVLGASFVLQVAAAGLALRLARSHRPTLGWMLVTAAVSLMALRRGIAMVHTLRAGGTPEAFSLSAELVALTISALMVAGLFAVAPVFRRMRQAEDIEASFGDVIENSLAEVYIFADDDLRFLRVNRGARANLGYSAEEMAHMTPLDLKPDFTEDRFREVLAPLAEGRVDRVRFTTRHRRKDGSLYPVEVDLQHTTFHGVPAYVAVILDTSEREEAARALRESEEHFRSLIEHSQDLTTVIDWDGTIVYQSPSCLHILGYDPEDRVGRPATDAVHPDDVARVVESFAAGRKDPDRIRTMVYRLRHADGSWRTMEGIGSTRTLPDGRRQFVINQRDITEREEARREQMEVQAQLQHAQRLEMIGTLAGGIAHDFNNLLTPIVGYATLLAEDLEKGHSSRNDALEILRAATRAQELVRKMLTYTRQSEQRLEWLELQPLVEEALSLVRAVLPTSIVLREEMNAPGEALLGDATQVHQVVMNLCTNAGQAMAETGGTLTVGVSRVQAIPVDTPGFDTPAEGPFLHLWVRDTGHGMDDQVRSRIFEPFFTTKGVREGTGLGLAVVHGIVLKHGGAISVESAPGEGSTFHVYFPSVGSRSEAPSRVEVAVPGGDEHILVVDDEEPVLHVVRRVLTDRGYRVTTIDDPRDALALFDGATDFDLIMTDLTMPHLTGVELARRVRGLRPDLPAVLITGYSAVAMPEQIVEAGIRRTLSKPFTSRELAQCVRTVLDEADLSA